MMFAVTVLILVIGSSTLTHAEKGSCELSQHCKNDTCLENDCTFGCKNGYFGRMCSSPCSSGCTNNACLQSGQDQGSCTEGCVDGMWGYKCSKACSTACVKCDRLNGSVCEECDGYHYGQLCQSNCYEKCPDSGCDRNGNCRENLQSTQCSYNCIDCEEGTGSCKLCKAGYAGKTCVYCKNCKGACSDDGCTDGCIARFHGTNCLKPCSSNCRHGSCFQSNGTCKYGCLPGYYGMNCDKRCPSNCALDECDRTVGHCQSCKAGFYDRSCVIQCSNCLSGLCHQSNGNCTVRCVDGYYGPKCNMKCDKNCDYKFCNRISGFCNKGGAGSGGSTGKPENVTATAKSETSLFAILGPIGILLLCCTVVGLLLFKFCKSPCFEKRRNESIISSDKVLIRALPDPPEDTNHDSYYVINEDDMDPSNQSCARDCLEPETAPTHPCSEDTNTSQNLTPSPVSSTRESVLAQEDCQNEEASDEIILQHGPESGKLLNTHGLVDSNLFHESSRTLLSESDLISKVENSVYRVGFHLRPQTVQGNAHLCIPKQYLSPVTDDESQF